jgi:hypothetical protein
MVGKLGAHRAKMRGRGSQGTAPRPRCAGLRRTPGHVLRASVLYTSAGTSYSIAAA